MKYSINWDLESIFPGGSRSTQLHEKMALLQEQLEELSKNVTSWNSEQDGPDFKHFTQLLALQEKVTFGLSQVHTFIEAVQSADINNKQASALLGKAFELSSFSSTVQTILAKKIVEIPDSEWTNLTNLPEFQPIQFVLNEIRTQGKELLSEAEEALINSLSIDGFQGWSDHYDTLVATIEIPFEDKDGRVTNLSAGQAYNKMNADPDAEVREQLFQKWEATWSAKAPLFSDTLNHLAGFRLADYQAHGVTDYLKRPLEYNRMKRETLDTMWQAVSDHKQPFIDYLNRKAQLLGKEKLAWQDIEAPVLVGNAEPQVYPYDQGAEFIIENFKKVSPKMADFAQYAFEHNWIEAENRSGKRPGGYCAELPESNESRIFMTYADSPVKFLL